MIMSTILPRYPIFIPSKGRADSVLTARCFRSDNVPFQLVVEPQELESYSAVWGRDHTLSLPDSHRGLVFARNWIKSYSISQGHERHWQLDDDIDDLYRLHRGRRIKMNAAIGLAIAEDFVDRYENVALASLNDIKFLIATYGYQKSSFPPFYLNSRCYTCFLVLNKIPYQWRNRYNEDTDMTLQALAGGWCTILFNAVGMKSPATLSRPGGQMVSQTANYRGDGRLKMARQLERVWPGVVTTMRRFKRAQHTVKDNWQRFDTPLKKKDPPPPFRDYGLMLDVLDASKAQDVLRHMNEKEGAKP